MPLVGGMYEPDWPEIDRLKSLSGVEGGVHSGDSSCPAHVNRAGSSLPLSPISFVRYPKWPVVRQFRSVAWDGGEMVDLGNGTCFTGVPSCCSLPAYANSGTRWIGRTVRSQDSGSPADNGLRCHFGFRSANTLLCRVTEARIAART